MSYEDIPKRVKEGGIEESPGYVVKKMKCKLCGKEHVQVKFKDMEYEWWQDWLKSQIIK